MGRDLSISRESFEALLEWLDPSRESAGQKYESIRAGLIRIFIARGCVDPEGLADDTINRVIRRLPDIVGDYTGEPTNYFYGVARHVIMESRRKKEISVGVPRVAVAACEEAYTSAEYDCLRRCLGLLPPEQRELVTDYYLNEKRLKIEHRKTLAGELGLSSAALRVRAHRIRGSLQKCVRQCVSSFG